MKLKWINESFLSQKIRDALNSRNFFNHSMVQQDQPYQATTGHEGTNAQQAATTRTDTPAKPRYRRYFGMERRLGTIRL